MSHGLTLIESRLLQLIKTEFIGVCLLTVPCSEGCRWSVDGYRHDLVTLISMGEMNVVEALHRLWPCYKSQGQRGDPQGQVGQRSWIPVQGLRYGPQGRKLCPPASEHLPWVPGEATAEIWNFSEPQSPMILTSPDLSVATDIRKDPQKKKNECWGGGTAQNVGGENTFASFCSGNPEQHPGRYRSVTNHHTTANIHLWNESKLRWHQSVPFLHYSPDFQFHSRQALKIRTISTENCQ